MGVVREGFLEGVGFGSRGGFVLVEKKKKHFTEEAWKK